MLQLPLRISDGRDLPLNFGFDFGCQIASSRLKIS